MSKVQDETPSLTDEEKVWIERNVAKQKKRHAKIVSEMEALTPERDKWIDGFLERIQTRGFNYNCDLKEKIAPDDIPEKPDRPFKVVY